MAKEKAMPNSREEIYEQVATILVRTVGIPRDEIELDRTLGEDLGVDSLSMVEVLTVAEDEFQIRIPDEKAKELTTVRSVVDYLETTLTTETAPVSAL
jgi:acyl carrier protein